MGAKADFALNGPCGWRSRSKQRVARRLKRAPNSVGPRVNCFRETEGIALAPLVDQLRFGSVRPDGPLAFEVNELDEVAEALSRIP